MNETTEDLPSDTADRSGIERLLVRVAEALHESGAPSYRIEASVAAVGGRFEMTTAVFAVPTGLTLGLGPIDRQEIRMIRTRPRSPALQRMRLVDIVIRDLVSGDCDADTGIRRLDDITARPSPWGNLATLLAFMLTGAGVAILSGGTMWTALAASVAAAGVALVLRVFGSSPHRAPLADFVAAFVAAVVANVLAGPLGADPRLTLIAAIIVLVPGLTLTIAMRELAMGELTAGSARLMGALTTFVALGFGAGLGEGLGEILSSVSPSEMTTVSPTIWTLLPAVAAAAIGLMVLLGEDPRMTHWFLAAVLLGWGSIRVAAPLASPEVTAAIAALAVGLGGNLANRFRGVPTALVAVPGLIVLVPGALGLTGFRSLMSDDPISGLNTIIDAMLIGGGLVAGLLVAAMLLPPRTAL
ncbi:MAG: hypothetical protein CMJ54_05270 [Planctomycetaceae bacterium]|nr:hypothetical protein [Planctomycetaceae bacterium]